MLARKGHAVRALVHRNTLRLSEPGVEIVQGDLLDLGSLIHATSGVGTVFHTAAHISVSPWEWRQDEEINVLGTRHLLDACRRNGVGRLVHFSSIEALVDEPFDTPVDESRPLAERRGYPPYARSKAAGQRWVEQAYAEGLDAIVLHPTAMLGPGDSRLGLPNRGLLALYCGRLPALVEGGFDWVDVRDVAAAAIRAAAEAPAGRRYILSGHWVSLRDIAVLMDEMTGRRITRPVCPMWLARVGAPFATVFGQLTRRQPLFTVDSLRPLRSNPRISRDRAGRELGYAPRPFRETVADTLAWFQECGYCR